MCTLQVSTHSVIELWPLYYLVSYVLLLEKRYVWATYPYKCLTQHNGIKLVLSLNLEIWSHMWVTSPVKILLTGAVGGEVLIAFLFIHTHTYCDYKQGNRENTNLSFSVNEIEYCIICWLYCCTRLWWLKWNCNAHCLYIVVLDCCYLNRIVLCVVYILWDWAAAIWMKLNAVLSMYCY